MAKEILESRLSTEAEIAAEAGAISAEQQRNTAKPRGGASGARGEAGRCSNTKPASDHSHTFTGGLTMANGIVAESSVRPKSPRRRRQNESSRKSASKRPFGTNEAAQWKQRLLGLGNALVELFVLAEDANCEAEDVSVRDLMANAEGSLHAWLAAAATQEPSMEVAARWVKWFGEIESMVLGAALQARAGKQAIEAVLKQCRDMQGDLYDTLEQRLLPSIGEDVFYAAEMERGFVLLADMLQRIFDREDDSTDIDPQYRGRDVAQWVDAVMDVIEQLAFDPWGRDGYAAALTAYLAMSETGTWPNPVRYFRTLTHAAYVGGPDTKYLDEEAEELPAAQPSANAWSADVAPLIDRAESAMGEAFHIEPRSSNDAFARQLVHDAQKVLDAGTTLLKIGNADDYYGEIVLPAQAMILGARFMPDTHPGLGATLQPALDAFAAAAKILDQAQLEEGIRQASSKLVETDFPSAARLETVRQAGCYVSRMISEFKEGRHEPTAADWDALHGAASIVMSGVGDPVESDSSLEERFDRAMDLAHLLLQDQLPRHLANGGAMRQQDIGKVLVDAQD
ncbi:hypothetical protein HHL11_07155 [Ramlibacter sp. G-1-2-2]|uniref:Uncharacterized protein n=1 Tax=Ramlibacter agri TaxID=2728837 RepID=A0A848H2Z1_9BURK|nr:hypothetical protein [Ramlibacter agri]NML43520.1 hypothetical protein [Ramlibacter agri]